MSGTGSAPSAAGAPGPINASSRHFRLLDGLRGVAALAVVAYHFGGRADLPYLMIRGYLAVDFFFVLSGFVVAHAYLDRLRGRMMPGAFVRLRLIRLLPMLIPGTIFGAVMEIWRPHAGDQLHHFAEVAMATVLGCLALPLPFATSMEKTIFPINGPVWSLFFEIFANVVFLLVARMRHVRMASGILMLVGGAGLAIYAVTYGAVDVGPRLGDWPGGFPRVLYGFFAGVMLSVISPALPALPAWIFPVLLLAVLQVPIAHDGFDAAFDLTVVLVVFPVLVAMARMSRPHGRAAGTCALAGDISYPIYAIHYPIVRAVCFAMNRHAPGIGVRLAIGAVTICVVCVIAWLALRFYDEKLRRLLSRQTARGVARSST